MWGCDGYGKMEGGRMEDGRYGGWRVGIDSVVVGNRMGGEH